MKSRHNHFLAPNDRESNRNHSPPRDSFFVHPSSKNDPTEVSKPKASPYFPPVELKREPSGNKKINKPPLAPTSPDMRYSYFKEKKTHLPPLVAPKPVRDETTSVLVEILSKLLNAKKQTLAGLLDIHRMLKDIYILICNEPGTSHKEKLKLINEKLEQLEEANHQIKIKQKEINDVQMDIQKLTDKPMALCPK